MMHVLFYFSTFSTAVLVSFADTNYNVVEQGIVEVGIELIGNLSFPIDINVKVNSASAMGMIIKAHCTFS